MVKRFVIVSMMGVALLAATAPAPAAHAQSAAPAATPAATAKPRSIASATRSGGPTATYPAEFALGDEMRVCLDADPSAPIDLGEVTTWRLLLDGRVVSDAKSVRQGSERACLIFTLARSTGTREAWNRLLGAPTAPFVQVTLGVAKVDTSDPPVTTVRLSGTPAMVRVTLVDSWKVVRVVLCLVVLILGAWAGRRWIRPDLRFRDMFRDRLLPQIAPDKQPFSLGRLQMGFWFALILFAFLFLWAYLGEYDTISAQALTLMGISAATGLGAIAAQGSNATEFNNNIAVMQAGGLYTAANLDGVRSVPNPSAAQTDALNTYNRIAASYTTQGFLPDILNENGSPALHRLQVAVWTLVLGGVFVWGVWQSLAMPEFSSTLLTLMAVSGGSYVGFKAAEKT